MESTNQGGQAPQVKKPTLEELMNGFFMPDGNHDYIDDPNVLQMLRSRAETFPETYRPPLTWDELQEIKAFEKEHGAEQFVTSEEPNEASSNESGDEEEHTGKTGLVIPMFPRAEQ